MTDFLSKLVNSIGVWLVSTPKWASLWKFNMLLCMIFLELIISHLLPIYAQYWWVKHTPDYWWQLYEIDFCQTFRASYFTFVISPWYSSQLPNHFLFIFDDTLWANKVRAFIAHLRWINQLPADGASQTFRNLPILIGGLVHKFL